MSYKLLFLVNQTFGYWLVIKETTPIKNARVYICKCRCGTVKPVYQTSLVSGASTSCGCFRKKYLSIIRATHGRSKTPEYDIWIEMKKRCYDKNRPNYKNYGGRGIRVCRRWKNSFENFYANMGNRPSPKHSIERKNVNKNYEPNNCCWATKTEQMNNTTRNRILLYNGRKRTLAQLAKEFNRKPRLVWDRIFHLNWPVDRALTEKPHNKYRQLVSKNIRISP